MLLRNRGKGEVGNVFSHLLRSAVERLTLETHGDVSLVSLDGLDHGGSTPSTSIFVRRFEPDVDFIANLVVESL